MTGPAEDSNRYNKRYKKVKHIKRLIRLEQLLLRGITNQFELAAAFGVGQATICRWIKEIYAHWQEHGATENKDAREKRIRQLDSIAVMALNAFEKSSRGLEEYTKVEKVCMACDGTGKIAKDFLGAANTSTDKICEDCEGTGEWEYLPEKMRRCDPCNGSGIIREGKRCKDCQGKGRTSIITTRVKGQAGDPSFLKVAASTFDTAAKLQGLYPQTARIGTTIITDADAAGGEVRTRIKEIYYEAPEENLIEAKAVLDRLRLKVAVVEEGSPKNIESRVIDHEEAAEEEDEGDTGSDEDRKKT